MLIQAERIWVGPGKIEEGWALRVDEGRIADIGPLRKLRQGRPPGETTLDCGRTVLMPGLVNAHVHLELGWLRDRVSPRGGFSAWVRDLRRLQEEELAELKEEGFRRQTIQAIRLGALEMLHHGTTAFLDVSNGGLPAEVLPEGGPLALTALECLGLHRDRAFQVLERARAYLDLPDRGRVRRLVVPHALYSCSEPLLRGLSGLAQGKALSTLHLMESREEADLFQLGMGNLRSFVDEICPTNDLLPGEDPLDRLEGFYGLASPLVAVHGYALSLSQMQRLARSGAAVCLCPSSRANLVNPPIPLADLVKSKVPICLGTDSLASAPSLSLWTEMRILHEEFPSLDPGKILQWATEGGARALGLASGRLQTGLAADWIAVECADVPEPELEDFLVAEEPEVRVVSVEGEILLDGRWES